MTTRVSTGLTPSAPVRVTIDIESEHLAKLSDDQRSAIRENLKPSASMRLIGRWTDGDIEIMAKRSGR